MKNLVLFVHPTGDFLEEHKTSIKIQIDNMLELGWKAGDIILATNFPYEYRGIRSLLVSGDNYCTFCPTFTLVNVIIELFERKLIEKGKLYWYHDEDAFQLRKITASELDLGEADMALCYKGIKEKWDAGNIFFKSSAGNIFHWLKEIAYTYKVNEEYALMALYTNNLLWITDIETVARQKFVPLYVPGKSMAGRIKTLNLRYMFGADCIEDYQVAKKPLKVVHFHFSDDLYLDSAMYGKNSLRRPLMTKRLIKIFHKHGVKGTFPKKMKNLMIYLNSQKRFPDEPENLVKKQIDNSLQMGWKKEDIILVTNFPYTHSDITAMVIDYNTSERINDKASITHAIFHLLEKGVVEEAELWWYHDLDVFQLKPAEGLEIELEDTTAGFTTDTYGQFNFRSFFFRKGSQKLFEWIRNRARRLHADEATALASLSSSNYRGINSMFKRLKLVTLL